MHTSALLTILPVFLASTLVSAHGIVREVTIAGTKYTGPEPNQGFRAPGSSIVRQVFDTSPVQGTTDQYMNCGSQATPASDVASAKPGDEILFNWGSWPHRVGPIMTYMASCGSTTCEKFASSNAKWFKIGQQGLKDGNTWYQADVANGSPARATIPANLAPGGYLVRHEIIALHNAGSQGGAEFYPSCTQVRVTGSGTAAPAANEIVSFPGAYSDSDPGILVNVYQSGLQYTFPGPAVAKLSGSSSGGSGPVASPSKASSTTASQPTTLNNGGSANPTTVPGAPAQSPSSSAATVPTSSQAGAPAVSSKAASSAAPAISSRAAPAVTSSPAAPATSSRAAPTYSPATSQAASLPKTSHVVSAPASQPSQTAGQGQGHGGSQGSCSRKRRSLKKVFVTSKAEPAQASASSLRIADEDIPAPINADAAVAKRQHSRVMRRLASMHSH